MTGYSGVRSAHRTFDSADNDVTVRVFADGDVVVCHGPRGNVENIAHSEGAPKASSRSEDGRNDNRSNCEVVDMADVSGYGPLLNMCDRLDVPASVEQDVLDFVHDKNELIDN